MLMGTKKYIDGSDDAWGRLESSVSVEKALKIVIEVSKGG
jgi:hypothetical protein